VEVSGHAPSFLEQGKEGGTDGCFRRRTRARHVHGQVSLPLRFGKLTATDQDFLSQHDGFGG
jgi:hypothetical protein